jgi:hypothetical protein
MQMKCDTPLERSQGELKFFFRSHPNPRSEGEVMILRSPMSPNWDSFGTLPWESRDKKPFGCECGRVMQIILYGGRWWLPLSLGRGESCEPRVGDVVNLVSLESHVVCLSTESAPKCELTNLLVGLMQVQISE